MAAQRRAFFDLGEAMRADQRRYDTFQADREALIQKLTDAPRRPVTIADPGMDPESIAEVIYISRRASLNEQDQKVPAEPAIAILLGRRELKKLREMPGCDGHLECWPDGQETFDQVPIIVRKGAGPVRIFTDLQELDAACRGLPQTMQPAPLRRRY